MSTPESSSPDRWFCFALLSLVIGVVAEVAWLRSMDYNKEFLGTCTEDCYPDFTYTKDGMFGLVVALLFLPAGIFLLGVFNLRLLKHAAYSASTRCAVLALESAGAFAVFGVLLGLYVPFADLAKGYAYKHTFCNYLPNNWVYLDHSPI